MTIKNLTGCPTPLLKRILARAGKLAGARTENVYVRVGKSRDSRTRGYAYRRSFVYKKDWEASVNGYYSSFKDDVKIPVDGGFVYVQLPSIQARLKGRLDPIDLAEDFFWLVFHEFFHIFEFQQEKSGIRKEWSKRKASSGRRPKHSKRPEEVRNFNAEYDAKQRPLCRTTQDLILELALFLEG